MPNDQVQPPRDQVQPPRDQAQPPNDHAEPGDRDRQPRDASGPLGALRTGRLGRRLPQLYAGLALYGVSMALMIRGDLGLDPWDVFHQGLAVRMPLSFGTIVILVSLVVLLAWIPLRQWPGLGTVSNALLVGVAVDLTLAVLPAPDPLAARIAFMLGGVVLNAVATAAYIGARLGPGPRDGLMTGLVGRTGGSVRVVRTSIEVVVLAIGWLLGGTVGVGTVVYALGIGPLVHALLPRLTVPTRPGPRLPEPSRIASGP
ncbi:membrane protein YczE [Actinopolymorpha singaporensis]